jgi:hypothetical protein
MVNDGLMVFVSQVKDGLSVFCKEYMRTDEHMVGIYAQVIPAGAHIAAELQQLLEEPSATVFDTAVRPIHLQIDLFRTKAEYSGLIYKYESIVLAKLDYLLLWWGYDIDVLDRVGNTMPDAFQAQREDAQVFGHQGYHHVDRLLSGFQFWEMTPCK